MYGWTDRENRNYIIEILKNYSEKTNEGVDLTQKIVFGPEATELKTAINSVYGLGLNSSRAHRRAINVKTYNNKVVKVEFADGTFEKAVCQDGDTFDLDMGITVCLCKRLLGGSSAYFKELKRIKRWTKNLEESKKQLAIFKEEEKQRQRKKEAKNRARREKRNKELAEAIARAQKEAQNG